MRTCVICGKDLRFSLLWELEKFWLRLTEVSLLWGNCCSEKCYVLLLEKLISGELKIGKDRE